MDLQGNESISPRNFIILEIDHLVAIKPGGYLSSHYFYPQFIPFAGF